MVRRGESIEEKGRDDRRTKDLASAVLLRFKEKEYRIRYYLSSEKLKTVASTCLCKFGEGFSFPGAV